MLARGLEERLGKSFVVENRPGAGTVLAAHVVAKAAPDGRTLRRYAARNPRVRWRLWGHLKMRGFVR